MIIHCFWPMLTMKFKYCAEIVYFMSLVLHAALFNYIKCIKVVVIYLNPKVNFF